MEELKRWFVLISAGLLGCGGAVLYGFLTWGDVAAETRSLSPGDAEWVKQATVAELCCIFFGGVYWSGRLLARLIGARALSEEIRWRSRWHLGVLHLMLAATLLFGQAFKISRHQGSGWIHAGMIGLGIALMALSLVFFLKGPKPRISSDG